MTNIKYLLAMDTTSGSVSVCVYDCQQKKSLADNFEKIAFAQGEVIIPMIDKVLKSSGINKSQLDAIGVCTGPGFFTGIRICLATAKAMSIGLNIPMYGVDALSVIAFELDEDKLTVLQDTKRSDLYVATFKNKKINGNISALEIQDIKINDESITGSGLNRYLENKNINNKIIKKDSPTALGVADLINYNLNNNIDCSNTQALYLRPADVSMPKNK